MGKRDNILIALSKIDGITLEILNQLPDNEVLSLKNQEDIFNYVNYNDIFDNQINKPYDEISKAYNMALAIKEACAKDKVEIITKFDDGKYPERFKKLSNYPPFFFARGNSSILKKAGIAIIGTKHPSNKGSAWGTKLSQVITNKGYVIISGLAVGCDSCAHIGCLMAKGETVAITPSPLNKIYPSQNKKLFQDILENNGCLISEYEFGHTTSLNDFVMRDRLQAGLAIGTIVIESSVTGGTLHAVNTTLELKRPLAFLKFGEEHYATYEHARANKLFLDNNKAIPIANALDIDKFLNECQKADEISSTQDVTIKTDKIEQSLF